MTNHIDRTERPLRHFFYALLRHKWKVGLVILLSMSVVGLRTLLSPDVYRSDAKLFVRLGRENVGLDPTATVGDMVAVSSSRVIDVDAELQILRTRGLAEMVVQKYGAAPILGLSESEASTDESTRQAAVSRLRANLILPSYVSRMSSVIPISYEAHDPDLAQQVLSLFIDGYREHRAEIHRTTGSYEFFLNEQKRIAAALADVRDAIGQVGSETGVVSPTEQLSLFLRRGAELRLDRERAQTALAASSTRVQELKKTLASLPAILETSGPEGDKASTKGMRLRLVEPAYIQLQLDLLSEEANHASLTTTVSTLDGQLLAARREIDELSLSATRVRELTLQRDVLEGNYVECSANLEQSRTSLTLSAQKISNISTIQAPTLSLAPVRPNRRQDLGVGLLLSIMAGCGIALLIEYLDRTVRHPEDLELQLGMRNLVTIPYTRTAVPPPVARGRADGSDARCAVGIVLTTGSSSEVRREELASYESLRNGIAARGDAMFTPPKMVGVTSCYENEGVTTVAGGLARVLGLEQPKKTLFLPFNAIRQSSAATELRHLLSVYDRHGQLVGQHEARKLDELLSELRATYSYVVWDLPAVNDRLQDLRVVSSLDGVILVVAAERARSRVVLQAKQVLMEMHSTILGTVLNKRRQYVPSRIYGDL